MQKEPAMIKPLPPPGPKAGSFFPVVAIAAVSFAVYFNALFNGFVYDDNVQIVQNPWIRDVSHLPDIFSKGVWSFMPVQTFSPYYRPLMQILYLLNYHIFGLKAWGFHLVNILFHAGNSVLVLFVASRLLACRQASEQAEKPASTLTSAFFSPPFIAALLFATHPIHTEAVTWVAGLPDLSFTLFSLLSFYLYIRPGAFPDRSHLLSVVFFSLALLCKETALILPLIFIAYDLTLRKERDSVSAYYRRYIPHIVVTGLYLIARWYVLGGFALGKTHGDLTAWGYVINVFPLFAHYMEKLLLPVNLNNYHVFHPLFSLGEMQGIMALAFAAASLLMALVALRKNRFVFFSILLMVLPLLPVLYIPALGENTFAERYLYLPSVGFVILLSLLLSPPKGAPIQRIMGLTIVSLMVVCLYSAGTISRNRVWNNDYTLFSDTVGKSPDHAIPRVNLGNALLQKGLIGEAIDQYMMAIRLNPSIPEAYNNLGDAFYKKGWTEQAIEQFRIALELNPAYEHARINMGLAFLKKGWTDQAIEQFQAAIALNPYNAGARSSLGNALFRQGLTDEAIQQYQIAVKMRPRDSALQYNLGLALLRKGYTDQAVERFRIALGLNPNNGEAHFNLANALFSKDLVDEAIEHYRIALSLNPSVADIHHMLGLSYAKKGETEKAIEFLRAAVRLNPDSETFRQSLERARRLKQ